MTNDLFWAFSDDSAGWIVHYLLWNLAQVPQCSRGECVERWGVVHTFRKVQHVSTSGPSGQQSWQRIPLLATPCRSSIAFVCCPEMLVFPQRTPPMCGQTVPQMLGCTGISLKIWMFCQIPKNRTAAIFTCRGLWLLHAPSWTWLSYFADLFSRTANGSST